MELVCLAQVSCELLWKPMAGGCRAKPGEPCRPASEESVLSRSETQELLNSQRPLFVATVFWYFVLVGPSVWCSFALVVSLPSKFADLLSFETVVACSSGRHRRRHHHVIIVAIVITYRHQCLYPTGSCCLVVKRFWEYYSTLFSSISYYKHVHDREF